ncbi:hypothetical protein N9L31_00230 [bacterium]|nr:hypothetical protein [bacterium]
MMIALFVAAVLFMFCLDLVATDFAEHASTIAAPVFILVSFCQTVATFLDTRMPWAAFLRRLMVIFSSLNFNLELTRPECAGDSGALQKVQFALGMPLFVGAAMAVYAFLTLIRIKYAGDATAEQRHSARNELRRKLASALTTLFTVGAIFFTKSFLRVFDCVASELDSSRKFMASAPEILCSSPAHAEIESLSKIGLIAFAGCFVIIWLFLLQNHLSDNPGLGTFAFLADKFEDHFFLLGDAHRATKGVFDGYFSAVSAGACCIAGDVSDHLFAQHSHRRSAVRRCGYRLDRDAFSVCAAHHTCFWAGVHHPGALHLWLPRVPLLAHLN